MVTSELNLSNALNRHRIGTALVWVGALTWVPFIYLRVIGQKPNLLWFLPLHLLGVVGGSRLRKAARLELGAEAPAKSLLRNLGHALIFLGILTWLPYFYLKLVSQTPVDAGTFLPYHLTGILSGVSLLLINSLIQRRQGTQENQSA